MKLSIILPTYNEAQVVGRVVADIRRRYPDSNEVEVLVIDDGSSDNTGEAADAVGARVIRHPYNKGNGAAIKTGIRAARGEILVMMDADGQHDPADIERLVAPIGEYDMVVGARGKGSQQWHRQLANSVYNAFAAYLTGFVIQDLTSGFRAVRRKLALQFCYLLPNTFSYPTTLTMAIIKAGYSLKYIEIQTSPRVGKSKINLVVDGLRFFVVMAKIATIFSPLKVFLPLGLLVFFPGAFYAIYRLAIGQRWTIPIVISVSVGAVILSLGLISEQIALLRMQHIDLESNEG
ncbi:MAG: glycosyltransferase family 2 protein [Chloroflexi bacterium]|nr:MAG: glycosyltransferase family 2 protein [Chloroflexota bacterium]